MSGEGLLLGSGQHSPILSGQDQTRSKDKTPGRGARNTSSRDGGQCHNDLTPTIVKCLVSKYLDHLDQVCFLKMTITLSGLQRLLTLPGRFIAIFFKVWKSRVGVRQTLTWVLMEDQPGNH